MPNLWDGYEGAQPVPAEPNLWPGDRAPVRFTVRPPPPPQLWDGLTGAVGKQTPPSFALPPEAEQPGIVERNLPKVYDPLQQQQQEVFKHAFSLTPMGAVTDAYDAIQQSDPTGLTMAAAGMLPIPGARAAAKAAKAAKAGGEVVQGFAPSAPAIRGAVSDVSAAAPYVTDPIRVANPGVYKRPDVIAREAAENVAPEHPALKSLFGVTRDDLYEISKQGTRPGNIEPKIWMPSKETKGSYAADAVMNPANAQRLVDTLSEVQKYPELIKGMDPWYVMDPMYQRMVKLVGPEEAKLAYTKLNASVGPFSAGSNVSTEINRGTAAHMAAVQGNYPEFRQFAGVAESKRGADFPDWLRDVKGHAYHGVQADPVTRWLATGEHGYANDTVKIPLYLQASGVPQTGFQTRLPVPDAHFTRAIGMPDVRRNQSFNDYMGGSEYRPVGPWFRENVAKPLGIEAVPAQARMWGTFAPQTGVDTAIGAGKLELMAQNIWERAKKLGIDPKKLRDDVLMGKNHATWLGPVGIGTGAALAPGLFGGDEAQAGPVKAIGDVLYHGTSKDKGFSSLRDARNGTWFSTNPKEASDYAVSNDSMGFRWENSGPVKTNQASRVIPMTPKFEKTLDLDEWPKELVEATNYKKAQGEYFDKVRAKGYDSVRMKTDNGHSVVVSLDNSKLSPAYTNADVKLKPKALFSAGAALAPTLFDREQPAPDMWRR